VRLAEFGASEVSPGFGRALPQNGLSAPQPTRNTTARNGANSDFWTRLRGDRQEHTFRLTVDYICASCSDTGVRRPCAAVACSFITLAAWVRQLPFWLLNSLVVIECLQSGQLNLAKPFIILMV
jgi:hypothetical protein